MKVIYWIFIRIGFLTILLIFSKTGIADPVLNKKPDYDSGWTNISASSAVTFQHNLGGNVGRYYVDMSFKAPNNNGINQRAYGGMDHGSKYSPVGARRGAYWRSLNTTSITVYRRPDDIYAQQVRIRIWRMPQPAYDSGWTTIAQETAKQFNHNIGGDVNQYLVDMTFFDTEFNGINQRSYGGMDQGSNYEPVGNRTGAYWRSLNNHSVTVFRRAEDDYVDQVRIRIYTDVFPWILFYPAILNAVR